MGAGLVCSGLAPILKSKIFQQNCVRAPSMLNGDNIPPMPPLELAVLGINVDF